jgi:ribosomal protein S18 acetylase RimI-like enzyme
MQTRGAWRVEPLSPARRDDFLDFLDHERGRAFSDNPAWSRCYCHFFHVAPAIDWQSLDAAANRAATQSRVDVGEMEGYLARDGSGRVVGWLNVQPRHKVPHCFARLGVEPTALDVPPHRAAVVLCFVIDPGQRRKGIARALLEAALADLAQRGVRIVDAFPLQDAKDAAAHFRGPPRLFADCGFVPAEGGAVRRRLS